MGEHVPAMQGGLIKLAEAEATVDTLTTAAADQRQQLTSKQAEVDAAMAEIEVAMEAAGSRKVEVEALSTQKAREQEVISKRKVCSCSAASCFQISSNDCQVLGSQQRQVVTRVLANNNLRGLAWCRSELKTSSGRCSH